jgi:hypothetical protein
MPWSKRLFFSSKFTSPHINFIQKADWPFIIKFTLMKAYIMPII